MDAAYPSSVPMMRSDSSAPWPTVLSLDTPAERRLMLRRF